MEPLLYNYPLLCLKVLVGNSALEINLQELQIYLQSWPGSEREIIYFIIGLTIQLVFVSSKLYAFPTQIQFEQMNFSFGPK